MELSVCLRERAFAVSCGYRGNDAWFFPCGEQAEVLYFVQDIMDRFPHARLLYLRQEDAVLLREHFPGRFRMEPSESASEYLYDRTEYVTLPGRKYESIRWSINRLKSHHELRTEPLSSDNLGAVRSILAAWKPRTMSESYSPDLTTAALMLDNLTALEMSGVIVTMDGRAAAVAMGFPLSGRSFDIAFSKAPERAIGLLHYTRRALVSTLPDRYTIINGEEDLGIPGLRRAKQLEHPMGQIEMMEAYAE